MNEKNIKVLEFRDELIKLCKKYSCELRSLNRDDGTMNLEIHDRKNNWISQYIMEDEHENYNLYQEDDDYNEIYIMDSIINKEFNKESGEMCGLNNAKISCGILTNDSLKANSKLKELYYKFDKSEIEYFTISKDRKELRLKNGKRYLWIKLSDCSRGYRCVKIIIDRNITLEELYEIVLPICYACGRDDVEIF